VDKTDFYRAFEDRHRGSRELIKSRLAVYLPFVLPLKHFYPDGVGVDLGCGRGEWLELMQDNGLNVQGIDLDQGMLEAAQKLGLNAKQADAIEYLQTLASESQTMVSGFHLAEHLPFEVLQILIQQALRVLKPGGLMILETPNPENIVVGTANFYLDPTHHQPIPSLLLSFMVEHAGFETTKILRLQEPANVARSDSLTLLDVLCGVSPDYAVVGQKGGATEIAAATKEAFANDYGISLENLASKYDQQIKAKANQAEAKANQAEAKANQAEAKANQAEAKANQAEANFVGLLNSKSWRLTAPLRWLGRMVRRITAKSLKGHLKALIRKVAGYAARHPPFRQAAINMLNLFPSLKARLKRVIYGGAMQMQPLRDVPIDVSELTPRARMIYGDLKAAIARRKRENR